jgi:hypothetical protein
MQERARGASHRRRFASFQKRNRDGQPALKEI